MLFHDYIKLKYSLILFIFWKKKILAETFGGILLKYSNFLKRINIESSFYNKLNFFLKIFKKKKLNKQFSFFNVN